ncbi:MAG: hypothetical protein ACLUN5_08210, partial [Oscillospiraceae bacterium]
FAQCDSLYAACALWGLALALEGKPRARRRVLRCRWRLSCKLCSSCLSSSCCGRTGKLRLQTRSPLGALVLTALPALLGGKSIGALLSIYTAQTRLYTGLTHNAPSFALMNTTGLDVYMPTVISGMALAFGVCALLVSAGVKRAGRMTRAGYLRLALLPLAIVSFSFRGCTSGISIWRIF